MRLISPAFVSEQMIPVKHTVDGLDISPPLLWDEVPEETKSFALALIDLDVPGGWKHWLVCNIRAHTRYLSQGGPVPRGAREIPNDFGKQAYGGPCPPTGEHRYAFTLYALDTQYLPSRIRRENFLELCCVHEIETVEVFCRYRTGGPLLGI